MKIHIEVFPQSCMLNIFHLQALGYVQLKILLFLTSKAGPPRPPGRALIVQNRRKKITQLISSWSDPGLKITKDLVVGPTPPPPRLSRNY